MKRISRTPFSRSLSSFLGSSQLSRTLSAERITRTSRSLSVDPVEPIDAVFSTVSENCESADHLNGFQTVTRQLLANDVIGSLIQLQNDLHNFDAEAQAYETDIHSAQVASAYRRTNDNFQNSASF